METDNSNLTEEDLVLTAKLLAQDHEVHCVVGETGATLKQIREQSGASISISDGSGVNRLISVTGTLEELYEACKLIIDRFAMCLDVDNMDSVDPDYLLVKLIVPASQCGPLIGKGGSKIKEIRDNTGASMQVAAEMLPNSYERVVNISGTAEAILDCIYEVCLVLIASPQKMNVLSYRPNGDMLEGPIIFSEGKLYTLQGSFAVPIANLSSLSKYKALESFFGFAGNTHSSSFMHALKSLTPIPKEPIDKKPYQTTELCIPDGVIDGIIGRSGVKISEIRQITGATIIVPNADDIEPIEKIITIKGTRESVTLAKYLIDSIIELQKTNPENQMEGSETIESESATSSLTNLLSKPGALSSLSNFLGYQTMAEFLNSFENYSHYRL